MKFRISLIWNNLLLLINPFCLHRAPAGDLLRGEPKTNFLLSRLHAVATMDDVPTNVDAVVPTDSARVRVL